MFTPKIISVTQTANVPARLCSKQKVNPGPSSALPSAENP